MRALDRMSCQLCAGAEPLMNTGPGRVCRDCLRATAAFVAGASEDTLRAVWLDDAPRGEWSSRMKTDPRVQEFLSETLEAQKAMVGEVSPLDSSSETHADLGYAYFVMGLYRDSVREAATAVLKDNHPPALLLAAWVLLNEQGFKPGGWSLLKHHLHR